MPTLSALLMSAALVAPAETQPKLALPVLTQAPSMARSADLSTWRGCARIEDFSLFRPDDQGSLPHRTVAHVGWGPDGLYVAVEAEDPEPARMRVWPSRRDEPGDQDLITVDLDPSGSSQSAIRFMATALGDQAEGIVSEMHHEGDDVSYDTLWSAVGLRTPTGYLVKFRIPYSSLRRAPGEWGLRIQRRLPRERSYVVAWPRQRRDERCEICQMARVTGAPGGNSHSPFLVIPFLSGHREETLDRGALGAPDTRLRGGLDLRYSGKTITLDGTYRPDFSSVEADVDPLEINTRFKVPFPEKRPFFLEGMDLFAVEGAQRQFFSRAIADPLYGLKAAGSGARVGWSALVAKDLAGGRSLASDGAWGTEGLATRDLVATARGRLDDRGSNVAFLGADRVLLGGAAGAGGRSAGLYLNQLLGDRYRLKVSGIQGEATLPSQGKEGMGEAVAGVRTLRGKANSVQFSYSDRSTYLEATHSTTSPELVLASGFTDLTGFRRSSFMGGCFAKWNEGPISEVDVFVNLSELRWWDGAPMERGTSLSLDLKTAQRLEIEFKVEPGGRSWAHGRSVSTWGWGGSIGSDRSTALRGSVGYGRNRTLDLDTGDPALKEARQAEASGQLGGFSYALYGTDKRLNREADGSLLLRARQVKLGAGMQFPEHLYLKAQAYFTRYDRPSGGSHEKYAKVLVGWQPNAFTHAYLGATTRRRLDPFERLDPERMVERGLFAKFAYALQF